MWIQDGTREDLLSIIQSDRLADRPLRQICSARQLPNSFSELRFLWKEDPRVWSKLPTLIILEKIPSREFFAWTGTYLPNCRPITAYCRVINSERLQEALKAKPTFALGSLETICIGLILAEAATYVVGQSNVNRLSSAAFTGTYSYAITRAIAANLPLPAQESVGSLWIKARQYTGQRPLNLTLEDLDRVWGIVFSIFKPKEFETLHLTDAIGNIASACNDIIETGEISENNWQNLTHDLFDRKITYQLFRGPREERVLQVEDLLTSLSQNTKIDRMTISFVGGYLASRISPGTFDHHELLVPYLSRLPALLVWYGLCAGLPKDSKLRNFGFGIGRRIMRDATQEDSVLNRPKCDIALEELEVLYTGKNLTQNLHYKEAGHLIIEILPGVNCTMRNMETRQPEPSRPVLLQQVSPYDNKDAELRNLFFDLDRSLKYIDRIRNRLGELTGYDEKKRGGRKVKNETDKPT